MSARRTRGWIAVAALCAATAMPATSGAYTTREIFGQPVLQQIALSPTGDYLAAIRQRSGWHQVVVRRRTGGKEALAYKQITGIRRIGWIDDTHLLIQHGLGRQLTSRVASVSPHGDRVRVKQARVRARGQLVHGLPQAGEELLWAVYEDGATSVYRLGVETLLRADRNASWDAEGIRLAARQEGRFDSWVADPAGEVRAALRALRTGREEIWYREGGAEDWRIIARFEDAKEEVFPVAIAENGRDLIVASNVGRDTRALVELSIDTGELGREIFSHPDSDVTAVVYDYSGTTLLGATFDRDGVDEFQHFDAFYQRYQASLERAFGNRQPSIQSVSRERDFLVVSVSSPRDPGSFYLIDTTENTAVSLGRAMPWLDPELLHEVQALRTPTEDDLEIEIYFTRPRRGGDRPALVVLPHGGPVGVRDVRRFDPLVQSLAEGGLAVLQVNYRGSAGRGRTFLEAGRRQWSEGMIEDIDRAIDAVVERGWVDGTRVCIAGGSYGGYAALIGVVRRPERFRCAASLNGPTDMLFAYHAYFDRWKSGREYFIETVGDPEQDRDALFAMSPLYRAREIRVPILLVHGTEDRRVDVEHYHRMKLVLETLGKPHQGVLIDGAGHVPFGEEWMEFVIPLQRFLRRHLR